MPQLVDGQRRWGSIDVQPDRFGVTRYRLTVYPPGLDVAQRRRLRLWRGWPIWGAALWLLAEIALTQVVDPWPALAMSTATALSAGAAAWGLAGELRAQVHTSSVAVLRGYDDAHSCAVAGEINTLARAMVVADSCLASGDITAVDHEVMWWRVYHQLAPDRRQSDVRRA
ncbi:MAG: DUF6611 family protein [Mycobacterium sp.]